MYIQNVVKKINKALLQKKNIQDLRTKNMRACKKYRTGERKERTGILYTKVIIIYFIDRYARQSLAIKYSNVALIVQQNNYKNPPCQPGEYHDKLHTYYLKTAVTQIYKPCTDLDTYRIKITQYTPKQRNTDDYLTDYLSYALFFPGPLIYQKLNLQYINSHSKAIPLFSANAFNQGVVYIYNVYRCVSRAAVKRPRARQTLLLPHTPVQQEYPSNVYSLDARLSTNTTKFDKQQRCRDYQTSFSHLNIYTQRDICSTETLGFLGNSVFH
eukprot:TRINITY_DN1262_c0_g1_i1.p2 TRINITY_DN1262_c0_g1~~TRINITY_DN1262_c0_g1_i1.p2  ORF type:complete len:270 (+),score=-55.43 TRINITY_DN1262_c0_g1_i1:1171-1980(+)